MPALAVDSLSRMECFIAISSTSFFSFWMASLREGKVGESWGEREGIEEPN